MQKPVWEKKFVKIQEFDNFFEAKMFLRPVIFKVPEMLLEKKEYVVRRFFVRALGVIVHTQLMSSRGTKRPEKRCEATGRCTRVPTTNRVALFGHTRGAIYRFTYLRMYQPTPTQKCRGNTSHQTVVNSACLSLRNHMPVLSRLCWVAPIQNKLALSKSRPNFVLICFFNF